MNYYELLGVDSNASSEEIKKAYKMQMKKWHPDINKNEDSLLMSQKLNEAKTVLLDIDKRREYDEVLSQKEKQNYQKYTNIHFEDEVVNNDYEDKTITKWEVLFEFLRSDNIKISHKIFTLIFVLLESFFCFVLRFFVIVLSFSFYVVSNLVFNLLCYISPIFIILMVYLIYILFNQGYSVLLNQHMSEVSVTLFYIFSLVLSFVLFLCSSRTIISEKLFNFIYNKLDIYLFMRLIGYS